MISFHRIKFKRIIPSEPNKSLIERFQQKLENTYCDNIKIINDNKLIVENDLFRIKPDLNWNLWVGIGSAEINIKDSSDNRFKNIEYTIDFKRFLIIFSICLLACIFFVLHDFKLDDALFLIIFLSIFILDFLIIIVRHKLVFNKINKTALTDDNYDWPRILQTKSIEELKMMLDRRENYPQEVLDLVKLELERKKNKNYHQLGRFN
jgi:hypothetical protein